MSGEALYERYKEALKRGHVASLRGRVDEALVAYAEAARIAPERSTPHTSAGTALMRRKRPADALRHYEVAVRIGPRDEAALLGRAQALSALERRAEAGDAFDELAELQASGGKLADAVDAARRGLELAEGRHRRRTLEHLIERLRASEPGEPGRLALERALRVLEGSAMPMARPRVAPAVATAAAAQATAGTAAEEADAASSDVTLAAALEPEPVMETASTPEPEPEPVAETATEPEPAAEPGPEPALEPDTVPVIARIPMALDRALPDAVDLERLAQDAEMILDAGDRSATERFLDLASASLREGRVYAALDACYQALSLDPDDTGLHLALVQLYDQEGWTALANDKLDLLSRLATLDGDAVTAERITSARAVR